MPYILISSRIKLISIIDYLQVKKLKRCSLLIEVRWHGRGGQGVVTSSELLALAAIYEGKYVYHAPEFGPERRGAPVRAYTRIDDEEIEQHFGIYEPDIVVVIDPTLQAEVSYILTGLKKGGTLILNTEKPYEKIVEEAKKNDIEVWYVNAYNIAMNIFGRPFYNTPMLGALVKVSGIVSLESINKAIEEKFKTRGAEITQKNIQAVKLAYEEVRKYES